MLFVLNWTFGSEVMAILSKAAWKFLQLGGLWFFKVKITGVRQVRYATCIYCSLSVKINRRENTAQGAKIVDAFVFARVVGKNPKTPNLSPWLIRPL